MFSFRAKLNVQWEFSTAFNSLKFKIQNNKKFRDCNMIIIEKYSK